MKSLRLSRYAGSGITRLLQRHKLHYRCSRTWKDRGRCYTRARVHSPRRRKSLQQAKGRFKNLIHHRLRARQWPLHRNQIKRKRRFLHQRKLASLGNFLEATRPKSSPKKLRINLPRPIISREVISEELYLSTQMTKNTIRQSQQPLQHPWILRIKRHQQPLRHNQQKMRQKINQSLQEKNYLLQLL